MTTTKVVANARGAVKDIPDGASLIIGSFGVIHAYPTDLILALRDRGTKNLTLITETTSFSPLTCPLALVEARQIKRLVAAFGGVAGAPTMTEKLIQAGEIDFELVPFGTLCERLRAGSAGIPALYMPTGVGTIVAEGKERRVFSGKEYILEKALRGDYAFISAYKADTMGNTVFRRSGHSLNAVFAMAADVTIVEAEEIVEVGELDPEEVDLCGIYVDRVVKSTFDRVSVVKQWHSFLSNRLVVGGPAPVRAGKPCLTRELVALRAAREVRPGQWVNLGAGLPALVSQFVPADSYLHAEVGMMNYGGPPSEAEIDVDTYGASGEFLTMRPGTSFVSVSDALAMGRAGDLDIVMLGAYQVSAKGDLANAWTPKMGAPGVGGAMDLVAGPAQVIILMEHVTDDGSPRIVEECIFPLTRPRCVSLIITDLAVIEVTPDGLLLKEVAPGWSSDDVQALTAARLRVAPDLKEIEL